MCLSIQFVCIALSGEKKGKCDTFSSRAVDGAIAEIDVCMWQKDKSLLASLQLMKC